MAHKSEENPKGEIKAQMEKYKKKIYIDIKDYINHVDAKLANALGEMKDKLKNLTKQLLRNSNNPYSSPKIGKRLETKGKGKMEELPRIKGAFEDSLVIRGTNLSKVEIRKFDGIEWIRRKWGAGIPYAWKKFVVDITTQYDNVWEKDYFSQLTKIRQTGTVMDYTTQYQKLATLVDELSDDKMLELYIKGLREEIRHEIKIIDPPDMNSAIKLACQIEAKNRAIKKIHRRQRRAGRPWQ
eukprot:Gb_18447 [translate_table: standard]